MGILYAGVPLDWYATKPYVDIIKKMGIEEFITLYNRLKNRQGDCLKWGDEIEYQLVKFDHANKRVRVLLRGHEIIDKLKAEDTANNGFVWCPESGQYMVEATPGAPYGSDLSSLKDVEENMRRRRATLQACLGENENVLTMTCFPRLGCPDFTRPRTTPNVHDGVTESSFFPVEAVSTYHSRFKTLARNVRQRHGSKLQINVPIFRDVNTPKPFREDFTALPQGDYAEQHSLDDHIYLDAMGFGDGCSCLQVTFQTMNIDEARWLYDQLTPITPIMLALSAACPIVRGYLADTDCRWNMLSDASDDRTEEERGLKPLQNDKFVLPKSRCGTTDCYLYPCSAGYNDTPLHYEEHHLKRMVEAGVDEQLAKHIANLFSRDPLYICDKDVEMLENHNYAAGEHENGTANFDNIQTSVWMNMRFKPPPTDQPSTGWRVEFRPMELQLTDFENAAYACFVILLTRVIVSHRLTFLIPISKVDENMHRAQKRDAVLTEKFYFRKYLEECNNPPEARLNGDEVFQNCPTPSEYKYAEYTVNEIINGKEPDFPGLVPLIQEYLECTDLEVETMQKMQSYLKLIQQRANGELWTCSHFMREFVQRHPDYKHDSVVSDEICYDLVKKMYDVSVGTVNCQMLIGVGEKTNAKQPTSNEGNEHGRQSRKSFLPEKRKWDKR